MNNEQNISSSPFRVDIHHHLIPDFYVSALKQQGVQALHGAGFPKWSEGQSLELMDPYGIAAAITLIQFSHLDTGHLTIGEVGFHTPHIFWCDPGCSPMQQTHQPGILVAIAHRLIFFRL